MNDYRGFYQFPNDWEPISLLNSTYLKGRIGWQGLKASEFTNYGPYLVTGTDFVNGRIDWENCYHITKERFHEAPQIHLKEDDLLITKDGTIGKIALVKDCPEEAILNSGIFLMRCKDQSYRHGFLFYFLLSDYFKKYLRDTQGGSTIVHLYQREFERFTFWAPKLAEQERIAEILSQADSAIEETQALIDKYSRIKRGLMQDLLTRGIDENGNIRNKQTRKFIVKSGIEVPDEWNVDSLSNHATVRGGKRLPKGHSYTNSDTGFKYLRVLDFYKKGINFFNLENLSKVTFDVLARYEIMCGELFISIAGSIGFVGVLRPKDARDRFILTENALRIIPSDVLIPEFLALIMNSEVVQNQIWTEIGTGGGVPKLALHRVERLNIPIPPRQEQLVIVKSLQKIDAYLHSLQHCHAKFSKTKRGLMQDLLSGRKRVSMAT